MRAQEVENVPKLGQRLLGLLDQRGKYVVVSAIPFRLRDLLEEVADSILAGRLADEQLEIQVECSSDLEILDDTKSLLSALLAAVQNSRESVRRAGGGEHRITISAQRDGSYTIIRVEDTGVGFHLSCSNRSRPIWIVGMASSLRGRCNLGTAWA